MADKSCDLTEVRKLGMEKAQAKMRELKAAGIPVSSETFSDLLKASYAEAKAECAPVSYELTAEQLEVVRKICPVCVDRFTVNAKVEESLPATTIGDHEVVEKRGE